MPMSEQERVALADYRSGRVERTLQADERLCALVERLDREARAAQPASTDADLELRQLRAEVAQLREHLIAAEAGHDDEEAAHGETLLLWQRVKAELLVCQADRDALRAKIASLEDALLVERDDYTALRERLARHKDFIQRIREELCIEEFPDDEEEALKLVRRATSPVKLTSDGSAAIKVLEERLAESERLADAATAEADHHAEVMQTLRERLAAAEAAAGAMRAWINAAVSPEGHTLGCTCNGYSCAGRRNVLATDAGRQFADRLRRLEEALREILDNCGCMDDGYNPCANCRRARAALENAETSGR